MTILCIHEARVYGQFNLSQIIWIEHALKLKTNVKQQTEQIMQRRIKMQLLQSECQKKWKNVYPGASQYWVLCRIIWMILGWYFQDCRKWAAVTINYMSYDFGDVLVDQNYIDIIPFQETFEAIFNFTDRSVYQRKSSEVVLLVSTQKAPNTSALRHNRIKKIKHSLLSTTMKLGCLFLFISPTPPSKNPTQVS